MVPAGMAVEQVMQQVQNVLSPGDIIIDGGNSNFTDSNRRSKTLRKQGLKYIGLGVSGGEEGALKGPSLMPGGHPEAWKEVKPLLQSISAQLADGSQCCEWMGPDGAGHFVKMVHNGIEYGDMQLVCEAFHILRQGLGFSYPEIKEIFAEWNQGELKSYLIEITADILGKTDPETNKPVLDVILDVAGQKGTGKWTAQTALDLSVAIPQIAEAVFARNLSAIKNERIKAATVFGENSSTKNLNSTNFVEDLRRAVYAAKICSYAQGFNLIQKAAKEFNWTLNLADIAQVWRGGCIIRAEFLADLKKAFSGNDNSKHLLLTDFAISALNGVTRNSWRKVVKTAIDLKIPVPSMSSALNYFDGFCSENLPANLLQAQRDYFGAHTFERVDKPREQFFHFDWFKD
jgi:6-phosphogluconate dehydrogenase